ncbi:MAG: hypothetical protein QM791_16065 [Ferruginibacter sp.]
MRKFILFSFSLFSVAVSNAQGVGIGTTTPNRAYKLTVVGNNVDTSIAVVIDGNVLGQGLQVTRGGVGIGPVRAISQLTVATDTLDEGINASPAIFSIALSDSASEQGGVYGTYDSDVFWGVGVQGVGYEGVDYGALFEDVVDVGTYGSASIGVLGLSPFAIYSPFDGDWPGHAGVTGIGASMGVYAEATDFDPDGVPGEQYGIFAAATGSAEVAYAGYFEGDVYVGGSLEKSSGTFKIDHPLDPANKYLYHSFVESPDMMNIYNGNITTDANGIAVVTMPDYFDALNKDFRYQLTPIGTFAQAIVKNEINGSQFTIQTDKPNVKISWQVTGVRKDKYAEAHRVKTEVDKESFNKGFYLNAKEWGMPASKSIGSRIGMKKLGTAASFQNRSALIKSRLGNIRSNNSARPVLNKIGRTGGNGSSRSGIQSIRR